MGWKIDTIQLAGAPARVLRHRAEPFGTAVSVTLFPDRQLAIAVAANSSRLASVDALAQAVAEAFASAR